MIDKLTIAVTSMDAMVSFYTAVLRLEFWPKELAGHELQIASNSTGFELLLCPKALAGVRSKTNTVQARFLVPDVESSFAAGVRAGGKPLNEPFQNAGRFKAALKDPDGNSLELREQAEHTS